MIEKNSILGLLQFDRKLQPTDIETGFVKIEQPLNDKRIILGKTGDRSFATAKISHQRLLRFIIQIRANEFRRPVGRFQISGSSSTRAARAKAEIISPFHAAMILSSR